MDKVDKMHLMDKILRELDDVANSQTSLLKKIAQCEADNINLGNRELEKKLPEIHEHADAALTVANEIRESFKEIRDKFVADNKLDVVIEEEGRS